jgi:hypothetical protein
MENFIPLEVLNIQKERVGTLLKVYDQALHLPTTTQVVSFLYVNEEITEKEKILLSMMIGGFLAKHDF